MATKRRIFRRGPMVFLSKYLALFATVFGTRLWLIQFFSSPVPFWDQWDEAAQTFKPWLEGTLPWTGWFAAHNEHRILCTRVVDVTLLKLTGQWDPQLQMVVSAALVGLLACLFVFLARQSCGRRFEGAFFLLTAMLFSLPFAAENTLCGFQSQVYFLILFSSLTIFALGFHKPGSAWWFAGVVFSFISLFTMGSGLFAPAVVVVLMLVRMFRSNEERRASLITVAVAISATLLGVLLNVRAEDPLGLHARSLSDFLVALAKNLSWPFINDPRAIALTFLPIFILGIFYWRKRLTNYRAAEFALIMGLWVIFQASAIAYGRGALGRPPVGRHLDVLSIGMFANFMALIFLVRGVKWERPRPYRFASLVLSMIWLTTMTYGCIRLSQGWFGYVMDKKVDNILQEQNVRGFLLTGDENYIIGKPVMETPFPPERSAELIGLLRDPTIRSILPPTLTTDDQTRAESATATGRLLQHGWSILVFGLLAFVAIGIPTFCRPIHRFRPAMIVNVAVGLALLAGVSFVWNLRHVDEPTFTAAITKWINETKKSEQR